MRFARLLSVMLLLTLWTAAHQAHGVDYTWNTTGGGSWGDTTKWADVSDPPDSLGDIADGADNTADFSTQNITAAATVTLDGNRTIGSLKFGDATTATHDWTVSAGTPAGGLTLSVTSGVPTIEVVNRVATISAAITSTGGFTKTGAGDLALGSASNSFGDKITVSQGVLRLNAGNAAQGTAIDVLSGATLAFYGAAGTTYNTGTITGHGTLTLIYGSPTGATNSHHTLNSDITLYGGGSPSTLYARRGNSTHTLTMGALYIDSNLTIGTGTNDELARINGIKPMAGVTEPLSVTKTHTSTIIVRGESTYTGDTNSYAGTLRAGHDLAFGSGTVYLGNTSGTTAATLGLGKLSATSAQTDGTRYDGGGLIVANEIIVNGGGTGTRTIKGYNTTGSVEYAGDVTLNRTATLAAAAGGTTVFSGKIGGDFNLTVGATGDTGTVVLANTAADSDFGGAVAANNINVAFGTLAATNDASLGKPDNGIALAAGTTFRADAAFNTARTITLGGNAAISVLNAADTLGMNGTIGNSGTYTLTKTGAGTLLLGTTQWGPLNVSAGTLKHAADNLIEDLRTVTVNGGVWDLDGKTETIDLLNYTSGAVRNAGNLTITSNVDQFVFDGATLSSPMTLSGAPKLIFATALNKGTVSGGVTLDAAGTPHEIYAAASSSIPLQGEISGLIEGAGSFVKRGTGTVLLSHASNTFGSGQDLSVEAGTLWIAGDGSLGNVAKIVLNGGAIGAGADITYTRTTELGAGGVGGFHVGAARGSPWRRAAYLPARACSTRAASARGPSPPPSSTPVHCNCAGESSSSPTSTT